MAWGRRDSFQHRMARHITALRHEVGQLGRAGSRFGHDASDFGDHLWSGGRAVAKVLRRQARDAGRAVKDDPVPAVVAVAGFALFMNLLFNRKK